MEEEGAHSYNAAALACAANADSVSKQLFEQLVQDEERHFDEFDKQLEKVRKFGPNYLALQSMQAGEETGAQPTS